MLGDSLLLPSAYTVNDTPMCNKFENGSLWSKFCSVNISTGEEECPLIFTQSEARWIPGVPGFSAETFKSENEI